MGDLVIDEELVRSLLRAQQPELADRDLMAVPGGGNNRIWRLGEDLAVRLPRTDRAARLVEQEHRWVPELAPHLPIPVPVPVHLGAPSDRFDRPWIVTTWIEGEPGDQRPITNGPAAAASLAAFMRALHREAPKDAPFNRGRSVPLVEFADYFTRCLQVVTAPDAAARAREVWEQAVTAPPWPAAPSWIHADLHPSNIVVAEGTLAGVLDFGELCAGDPATDLASAWMLLPQAALTECIEAYGNADEAMIHRARGWAVMRSVAFIAIGLAGERGESWGMPTWKRVGEAALDRALADQKFR
ncbi:aminoglycoside phosphotransferase family protein [Glycomyces sp. NPDC046736]|uniref:aminoglycoside phosphotransferase family protein n=1 Tax=Glycomyces sp. NPDC046736 TaxID=3155615 RepID=UPI0033CF7A25